ncbi:unnamed protein product [Mucor circinelloides]|uniref:Chitin-binding type-2 domain-containing protein n=1 Tax=Mucor circinelloides f. circinelloides (strain 1006PhL) TaxID=1220926 RepID=S2J3V3_MUCC1|nr:hypothetical protein HMPREF1544_08454 [Mucor circinelloides 1006PhL]KAG1093378.1 hypothetical protein G6F42_018976 [Rhizopus arrhizus]
MQISLASVLFVLGVSLLGADAASLIKKRDDSMNCPSGAGGAGSYSDPGNCERYFYCTAGNRDPSIQYCQSGTLFSASLRRCVVASRADCSR